MARRGFLLNNRMEEFDDPLLHDLKREFLARDWYLLSGSGSMEPDP